MRQLDVRQFRSFSPEKMQKLNLFETPHLFCDVYCLAPGQSQKLHTHSDADKLYYVVEGEVVVFVGKEQQSCPAGRIVLAPAGEPHGLENKSQGNVRVLVVMAPNPNVKKDR
ncbi:MAG: cupin domain-containing protein [Terriglobia bacterium]